MRDVFEVCSGLEPIKTGLVVTKTHAHMTLSQDSDSGFEEVCLMDEVRVRVIEGRGCSACDIGQ